MASAVVPPRKRSLEESGHDVNQEPDSPAPPNKEPKLTPSAKASLDTLPTELLSRIAAHLSTTELLSLRLANGRIETQLFNDFAAFYFVKKQFMLTPESLQCLVDISRHPKLSTVLEHVVISLDKYRLESLVSDVRSYSSRDNNSDDDDSATHLARAAAYRRGAYDQIAFLSSGHDVQLLTQAFRNLVNLKKVGLRDYNSGMRRRDGEGAQWRAYGATTVLAETGTDLLQRPDGWSHLQQQYAGTGSAVHFAARAFTAVLRALGEAGAKPEGIEILTRVKANALPDYAFHIPSFMAPTVTPVLAGLKSLLLTIGLQSTFAAVVPLPSAPVGPATSGHVLEAFLLLTPALAHLRLNFTHDQPNSLSYWFLKALPTLHPQRLLPRLARLDFGMMVGAHPDVLARVVGRWGGTLEEVSFWKVSLSESAARRDIAAETNQWAELLMRLRRVAPGLRSVRVGCLGNIWRGQVKKVTIKVGGEGSVVSRVYGREDMRDLEAFRARLEKEFQLPYLEHDDDGGETSDSEESGEDGGSDEIDS